MRSCGRFSGSRIARKHRARDSGKVIDIQASGRFRPIRLGLHPEQMNSHGREQRRELAVAAESDQDVVESLASIGRTSKIVFSIAIRAQFPFKLGNVLLGTPQLEGSRRESGEEPVEAFCCNHEVDRFCPRQRANRCAPMFHARKNSESIEPAESLADGTPAHGESLRQISFDQSLTRDDAARKDTGKDVVNHAFGRRTGSVSHRVGRGCLILVTERASVRSGSQNDAFLSTDRRDGGPVGSRFLLRSDEVILQNCPA